MLDEVERLLRPPPDLPLSKWADEFFVMSEEDGGKWTTLPYQREIMDAMTDPEIERVTVRKSARVGYTKMLEALILEGMHRDPCSQIVVQPTVEDAEGFSKNHIQPAIDRHDFLRGVVAEGKSRSTGNTILAKHYFGRTTYFVGANSGRGFRRIHARRALGDEVDGWDATAGADGDQVELMYRRTAEAKLGRKLILGSTPLIKGASRIDDQYAASDQRLYYVPCPHCDEGQPLAWGGRDCDYGIKWPDGEPERAFYLCRHCHCVIEETQKLSMYANGACWVPHAVSPGHAGFHLWAGYSLSPNATWGHLASEFVRVHADPTKLRTWVNTWLGESFENRGRSPKADQLASRPRIPLREGADEPMVPAGAVVGTSFTDVQHNRLETGVEWWGLGEENWKTEYHVLYGDPTAEPVWQALWELLSRPRLLERGGFDYIRSSCIDSGYAAQSVYAFVRPRPIVQMPDGRLAYFWATKGVPGTGNVWPTKPSFAEGKNLIYPVKVDTAKDQVAGRLETKDQGPGYVHFSAAFDEDYFKKLSSEHAVDSRNRKGFPVRTWEMKAGHKRNEAWDIAVGNYAALCALVSMGFDLAAEAYQAGIRPVFTPPSDPPAVARDAAAQVQEATRSPVRQQESPWLGGRGRGWLGR